MTNEKRNKGRKKKAIYKCEICNGTQNKPVVGCDKCEKWHHFACVGIKSISKKDEWICDKCKTTNTPEASSPQQSIQEDVATPHQRNNSPTEARVENCGDKANDYDLRYDTNHPYYRASRNLSSTQKSSRNRSVEQQSDRQASCVTNVARADPTIRATSKRQEMELKLAEEERMLASMRDSEYLRRKYSILVPKDQRRENAMSNDDEIRSMANTRDWIEKQNSAKSVRHDSATNRSNVRHQNVFLERLESLRLDNVSQMAKKYPTPAKNQNQPKIHSIDNLLSCNICQMVGEDENFEACLLCFKQCHYACMDIIMIDEYTRYVCPDCKHQNGQSSQTRTKQPNTTNKKFVPVPPQFENRSCAICLRTHEQDRFRTCHGCQTICHYYCMVLATVNRESVWMCAKCKLDKNDKSNQSEVKLTQEMGSQRKSSCERSVRQSSKVLPDRKQNQDLQSCGTRKTTNDQQNMKLCDLCDRINHFTCLTLTTIDNEVFWLCPECKHAERKRSDQPETTSNTQSVSTHVNTSQQNSPMDTVSTAIPQTATQTSQSLTSAQIASRHVVSKDLPIFNGQPEQWPMFLSRFENSTKLCGFSESENLDRLQKCLKGNALDAVRSRLLTAESVPEIISTLKMLYGRPELIVESLIKKIRQKSPPKSDQLNTMVDFALAVKNVCATLEQAKLTYHLSNPALIQELVNKLPTNFKVDWARYKANIVNVTLSTLGNFLFDLAKVISTVTEPTILNDDNKSKKNSGQKDSNHRNKDTGSNVRDSNMGHIYTHQSETEKRKPNDNASGMPEKLNPTQCKVCKKNCQKIENCPVFLTYNVDRRWQEMYKLKLCRKCLAQHGRFCNEAKVCGVNGCIFKHHSLLHDDKRHSTEAVERSKQTTIAHNHNIHYSSIRSVLLRIVPVTLHWNNRFIFTFAYQDDGSDVTMIENTLSLRLGLTGNVEPLCLMWTASMHRKEDTSRRVEAEISGQGQFAEKFTLRNVRTVETLGLPTQTVNLQELVEMFPYLRNIPLLDYYQAVPQILIGSDNAHLNVPLEIVEGNFNQPIACKSRIGWSIHGRTADRVTPSDVQLVNTHRTKCPCQHENDEEMHKLIKEHFTVENFGVQVSKNLKLCSKEDERALYLLNKHTRRIGNRYETALLWKYDDVKLPESYGMALKRLQCLEKHKPQVIEVIDRTIKEYLQKGYAIKLTDEDIRASQNARIWYLPIFTVTYPKKPDKVRVVFDGAAKVNGVSLNSLLLKGPDQLSALVDILRRAREKCIAAAGDIVEMFPQIKIRGEDVHCQRFLWRNGDVNSKPDQYALQVMTFGANCSPTSAQFVKNHNASEFKDKMPRAVESIIHNHYVDDMLDCQHSDTEMIQLIKDVKQIHSHGGFEIRKFLSNSAAVKAEFNDKVNDPQANKCMDMSFGTERVLGMWWNTENDSFTYSLKFTKIDPAIVSGERIPTKREMLRILMTIFDPLGLLSHYLIHLKIVIQDIWRSKLDWDDKIKSEEIKFAWNQWFEHLPNVEKIEIPRLYSTKMSPTTPKSIELHTFVDASEKAFAAASYLRVENDEGDVDCVLVGSKARVSPLKYMSTPRLELQAGLLGTRLLSSIENALTLKIDRRQIWTDSRTLLSWLNSDSRRYHQFVAYRVGEILETTDLREWRWVPTKQNVADDATKWSKPPSFQNSSRWFSGPEFLKLPRNKWPDEIQVNPDTLEEMKTHCAHANLIIPILIETKNISTWNKMHRAVAYARRYVLILGARVRKEIVPHGPLTRDELVKAEILLLRQAQFQDFTEEMVILMRNRNLSSEQQQYVQPSSPLYKCTPYLDDNGLIRLHGRIDSANDVEFCTKRPIILPRNNRITRLLIAHVHNLYHHRNHRTVYNEIRQKYYVPQLRVVLNSVRKECQRCKNKQAQPQPPQMADLPSARLAIGFRAFTNVGIDYFGPMYVVIGRRTEKRWGVMITCLTVRAVHVEIAYKLDTESCIMCIRNFIYWRGCPREIYSDPGTNLKGMDNALQKLVSELDVDLMASEFTTCYTKWNFNPPVSPHMGGAWERMIRSVKNCLYDILPTRHPTEDMLRNLLLEVCNIINSRPLTYIPITHENDDILTPNHFILGSSNGLKPFIDVDADGPILRSKWMENQRLTDIFWTKFIKEFLPDLTRRTKWHEPVQPIQVGDIVLLVDGTNIRGQYPKCRVIETSVGSNNQVRRARIERFSSEGSKLKKSVYWRPATSLAKLDVQPRTSGLSASLRDPQTGGSVVNVGSGTDDKDQVSGDNGAVRDYISNCH